MPKLVHLYLAGITALLSTVIPTSTAQSINSSALHPLSTCKQVRSEIRQVVRNLGFSLVPPVGWCIYEANATQNFAIGKELGNDPVFVTFEAIKDPRSSNLDKYASLLSEEPPISFGSFKFSDRKTLVTEDGKAIIEIDFKGVIANNTLMRWTYYLIDVEGMKIGATYIRSETNSQNFDREIEKSIKSIRTNTKPSSTPPKFTIRTEAKDLRNLSWVTVEADLSSLDGNQVQLNSINLASGTYIPACAYESIFELTVYSQDLLVWERTKRNKIVLVSPLPIVSALLPSKINVKPDMPLILERGNSYIQVDFFTILGQSKKMMNGEETCDFLNAFEYPIPDSNSIYEMKSAILAEIGVDRSAEGSIHISIPAINIDPTPTPRITNTPPNTCEAPDVKSISFKTGPPTTVGTLVDILAKVDWNPCFRAARLWIDNRIYYELGQPSFIFTWDTSGFASGDHVIRLEVAAQGDVGWLHSKAKEIHYKLKTRGVTTSPIDSSQQNFVYIGSDNNIWTTATSIMSQTRQTIDGGYSEPTWSPDGNMIAYVHVYGAESDGSSLTEIGLMKLNGDEQHILVRPQPDPITGFYPTLRNPRWSLDGKFILYQENAGGPSRNIIRRVVLATGQVDANFEITGWEFDSSFFDGRIIFAVHTGFGDELQLISPEGGTETLLFKSKGEGSSLHSPRWSPDGKKVAFVALGGQFGSGAIVIVNDDGSGLDIATKDDGLKNDQNLSTLTWSSDGQGVIFESTGTLKTIKLRDRVVVTLFHGHDPAAHP